MIALRSPADANMGGDSGSAPIRLPMISSRLLTTCHHKDLISPPMASRRRSLLFLVNSEVIICVVSIFRRQRHKSAVGMGRRWERAFSPPPVNRQGPYSRLLYKPE